MLTTPIYQNPLAPLCFSSHLLHLLNLSPILPLLKAHVPLCLYDLSCASLLFFTPAPSPQSLPYLTTTEGSRSSLTLYTSIQSQAFNPLVYFLLFISSCLFPSVYFFSVYFFAVYFFAVYFFAVYFFAAVLFILFKRFANQVF